MEDKGFRSFGVNTNEIFRGEIKANRYSVEWECAGGLKKEIIHIKGLSCWTPAWNASLLLCFTYVWVGVTKELGIGQEVVSLSTFDHDGLWGSGPQDWPPADVGGDLSGCSGTWLSTQLGIARATKELRYLSVASHSLGPSCYFPRSNQIKKLLHLKCWGFWKISFHTNFSLGSDRVAQNTSQLCILKLTAESSWISAWYNQIFILY